jgi:hypothetical protein
MDRLAIVRRRLYSQRLAGRRFGSARDAVRGLVAMQGQEFAEAKWSVAQRCTGATDVEVQMAFDSGEILRTHLLRPTWHLVAPEDIRSLLLLTAPRVHRANAYMYRQSGLDARLLDRSAVTISEALADGSLTRAQIATRLVESGFDTSAFRLAYLLMNAELEGVMCSGPLRGKQHTYMRFDDRVPAAEHLDRDRALANLAFRFFSSRGPVTVRDFSYWSGLTLSEAREALEMVRPVIATILDDDGVEWLEDPNLDAEGHEHDAYLVPTYDETIMSYERLKVVLPDPTLTRDILQRPVVVQGVTVGSWKRAITGDTVTVEIRMFERLTRAKGSMIEEAVARFGRFLGLAPRSEFIGVDQ